MKTKRIAFPILNRHLKDLLGNYRFLFILQMIMALPIYKKRFLKPDDDPGLTEFKNTFLLVGTLYPELAKRIGEKMAKEKTFEFLKDIANVVQRDWYLPKKSAQRPTFDQFHQIHEYQMQEGLIRHNQHDEIVEKNHLYSFNITRCLFHETFLAIGIPWATEAFCHSDEIVFNEVTPEMKFHRGEKAENTIARGATGCVFIFERVITNERRKQ